LSSLGAAIETKETGQGGGSFRHCRVLYQAKKRGGELDITKKVVEATTWLAEQTRGGIGCNKPFVRRFVSPGTDERKGGVKRQELFCQRRLSGERLTRKKYIN